MVDIEHLQEIARRQRQLGLDVVDVGFGANRVRIRLAQSQTLDAADTGMARPQVNEAVAETVSVRAEALGFMRRTHAQQLPAPVEVGACVEAGQLIALLALGNSLRPVKAPGRGTVKAVLASEDQRVDYGLPLFELQLERSGSCA